MREYYAIPPEQNAALSTQRMRIHDARWHAVLLIPRALPAAPGATRFSITPMIWVQHGGLCYNCAIELLETDLFLQGEFLMWRNYLFAASPEEAGALIARMGPAARIVSGGTDLSVAMRNNPLDELTLVDVTRIPSMQKIEVRGDRIWIGAAVSYARIIESQLLREKTPLLVQAAQEVGSVQIRNLGTLGGNLATASPAGDSIPPLMSLGAEVVLAGPRGRRRVPIREFFTWVRQTVMEKDEIVEAVLVPPQPDTGIGVFVKHGLRRAHAISVVNAALLLDIRDGVVADARISLGAVAPTVIRTPEAEKALVGHPLTPERMERAASLAMEASKPIDDIRGSAEYRRHMVGVLVRKGLEKIARGEKPELLPPLNRPGYTFVPAPSEKEIDGGNRIELVVNGERRILEGVRGKSLLYALRGIGLLGVKDACSAGECGACTVLLDGRAVTSCLVPAPQAHGRTVETVEGLSHGDELHPLQEAFVTHAGTQCGYCTPGFIMSAKALLDMYDSPDEGLIKQALAGNLCRCTGYYQIVEAVKAAAARMSGRDR